mgnify:CR=1 FL=1
MRALGLVAFLLSAILPVTAAAAPMHAGGCEFRQGFAALRAAIPDVVGECLTAEHHDEVGNARQETTGWHGKGGLLYWRKADNWTGFTDGYRTWIAVRDGVVSRLNTERFDWEPDRLVPRLRDAEYRLPFGIEKTYRLVGGRYESRQLPFHLRTYIQLVESVTESGDLDGDGTPDAVGLLAVNGGGSGVFMFAVAMLDRDGQPVQAGYEFLGDRVSVNRFIISNGRITVDMVTHGPNDPMCCPTQRIVRPVNIRIPDPDARRTWPTGRVSGDGIVEGILGG